MAQAEKRQELRISEDEGTPDIDLLCKNES